MLNSERNVNETNIKHSHVVESTDSENENERDKSIFRRLSTSKCIGTLPVVKEGYLMKQTGSFQRWKRKYFMLRGRTMYYAKSKESQLFDEFCIEGATFAECGTKYSNHCFQLISSSGSLVMCAESRAEMESWQNAVRGVIHRGSDITDLVGILSSGEHHWFTATHARPTFCNVCREPLGTLGTAHALSCELCKFKAHKRCASRAPPSCKWTTLASLAGDIHEEQDGTIIMPHQWLEGNLPVSAKCAICDKNCGSVLRLQDYRCVWCRKCVHASCRPSWRTPCELGVARASIVPPTHLHSVGPDDAWEAERPPGTSPIVVFVNSKSGDNQGVKFLRRFRQLLNPAQVFELSGRTGGPRLGLQLFRHFEPLRVLVCSGDGSVGWVLQEIDRLDMHKQCKVAVLPLGTGNDLARVLGWGGSCDEAANLTQLLERYEKASTKMLDRWSIMTFERVMCPTEVTSERPSSNEITPTTNNIQHLALELTRQLRQVVNGEMSPAALSDTVTSLTSAINSTDEKAQRTSVKLRRSFTLLVQIASNHIHDHICSMKTDYMDLTSEDSDDSEIEQKHQCEKGSECKTEKDHANAAEKGGCALGAKANEVRKAVQKLLKHITEEAVPIVLTTLPVPKEFADSRRSSAISNEATFIDREYIPDIDEDIAKLISSNDVKASDLNENRSSNLMQSSGSEGKQSLSSVVASNNEIENSTIHNVPNLVLSDVNTGKYLDRKYQKYDSDKITIIDTDIPYTEEEHFKLINSSKLDDTVDSEKTISETEDSEISEDEFSLMSEIGSPPTRGKDPGSDTTWMNSETIHGESMIEDISSVLGITAIMQSDTYTDDTTILTDTTSDNGIDSRNPSLDKYDDAKIKFITKQRKTDSEDKYGFENRVFNLETAPDNESVHIKYCSLAHFVEGNDIARKSFKKHLRRSKKLEKKTMPECVIEKETDENINTEEKEMPEILCPSFPTVIVEPPSPSQSDDKKSIKSGVSRMAHVLNDFFERKPDSFIEKSSELGTRLSVVVNRERRCSDNPNLLSSDSEYNKFLNCSPAATRRISCGSLFKPGEADKLSTSISSIWGDSSAGLGHHEKHKDKDEKEKVKRLPIINPLVRLPAWPYVGGGFISQCLLANADALCAAVSPLMDPDETLMEGFDERAVMNNYFGIGIDAKIALDFHNKREEHPEKCRSRARNYMWYGVLGSKEWIHRTYRHLGQRVQLECDGQRIPLPELQGIVVLNIPSFMGGTNFWGGTRADELFLAPSFDDRILEVVAVFGSAQMAASRLINLQKHRIAQCRAVQINILGDECVPVQVDGEAWLQPPGCIRIIHKNRSQMLARSRQLETSLRSWDEKQQKLHAALPTPTINITSHASEDILPPMEATQLITFMDNANTLIKWIKLQSSRSGGTAAFSQARRAANALDALQDSTGKLLTPPALRRGLTHAMNECRLLINSANALLTSGGLSTNEMSALTACKMYLEKATITNGLTFLHIEAPRKLSSGGGKVSWLRSRKSVSEATPEIGVTWWGTEEVGIWLKGIGLGQYAEAFAAHDVTGRELTSLARRDLKELGVHKVGHLRRLLHALQELH